MGLLTKWFMTLKLCVAQLNFFVGDLDGNVRKIVDAAHQAYASGARLLLTTLHEMRRRGLRRGLASLCVGGGQGAAFVLESAS